jgi:hypothetical protein
MIVVVVVVVVVVVGAIVELVAAVSDNCNILML